MIKLNIFPTIMPNPETTILNEQIPQPLSDRVDQLAARQQRSRAWVVQTALTAWVDLEDERSLLTREAMDDIDAGSVVDLAAVQAWAESLDTDQPLPLPLAS